MQHQREFIKLLISSVISQSGSHFLTIALAGFVFLSSGSIIRASLIFVLSYLPSIVVGASIGNWIDRTLSRWLLARNELLAIVISVCCGLSIVLDAPLIVLCTLITLRSLLLFTARAGGIKWIKLITPPELQGVRVKFFFLSFFLATATAGILAAVALRQPSIVIVVLIDVGTYLLSFGIILTLRDLVPASSPVTNEAKFSTLRTIEEIFEQSVLARHFVTVCLSQAIFQGAYSVLVSYLPINQFQMGVRGLGAFQITASLGIIVGFLVIWLAPSLLAKKSHALPIVRLGVILLGVFSIVVCASSQSLSLTLFSFFLVNAAYECLWLFSSSEFFGNSSETSIGRYQFVLTSSASITMAIFTFCYAILIQFIGLKSGVIIVLISGILVWGCIARLGDITSQGRRSEL